MIFYSFMNDGERVFEVSNFAVSIVESPIIDFELDVVVCLGRWQSFRLVSTSEQRSFIASWRSQTEADVTHQATSHIQLEIRSKGFTNAHSKNGCSKLSLSPSFMKL